ncbi:hypothetical protein AcV7_005019 [Taiwanofungus camphoratus]|nr:hypothetical protein AcV7_005019 [Antrodia cinnamomea]
MSDRRGVALSPHGDVIEKPEPVHAHLPSHAVRIEPYRAWKWQSESAVYDLAPGIPAVATFIAGGDVRFPNSDPVSTSRLRGQDVAEQDDAVLHRRTLQETGRPLWGCAAEEEFILAFSAALIGVIVLSFVGAVPEAWGFCQVTMASHSVVSCIEISV